MSIDECKKQLPRDSAPNKIIPKQVARFNILRAIIPARRGMLCEDDSRPEVERPRLAAGAERGTCSWVGVLGLNSSLHGLKQPFEPF